MKNYDIHLRFVKQVEGFEVWTEENQKSYQVPASQAHIFMKNGEAIRAPKGIVKGCGCRRNK